MTESNSLSQAGWVADSGARSGRCRNDIYCLLANESPVLTIQQNARFVCPECFKPLIEVADPAEHRAIWRNARVIIGGGLAVAALCMLAARPVYVGRHKVSVFVVMSPPQNRATAESIAIPSSTSEIPLAGRKLASQQITLYRTLALMSPALALPDLAAWQTNRIALPRAPGFSKLNRGFSAVPIAGGEPPFPDSAESEGVRGLVRVTCSIQTNGTPVDCETNAVTGGYRFRNAIMSWLRSGAVRFAPILRHGQAVAEVHSWDIEFSPDQL